MNVKDNRKQDKKKISEIKPGTIFKHGDLYFIRTSDEVCRRRTTVTGISLCCDSRPEYDEVIWYEAIEAICVSDGRPRSFRYCELVEVFPKAIICLDEEKTNA